MSDQSLPLKMLKQTPHIVAFLDFLGATEKMKSPEQNDIFLQEINYVYAFAKRILQRTQDSRSNKLKIKIFSDNIVIAEEIKDQQNIIKAFVDIEQFSLLLYTNALLNRNIMRGAISIGQLYMDDTFVYGEALLNAYNCESKIATYPRIIVDKNVFACASEETPEFLKTSEVEGIIKTDTDGEFFLNPFWGIPQLAENNKNEIKQVLIKISSYILKEYERQLSKNKRSTLPKYHWLANQFNLYSHENKFDLLLNLDKIVVGGEA